MSLLRSSRASCDSPSDVATTQHLIASIVDPIEAALSSGQFLVLLSTNMVSSGTFSANVGACLEVWGAIGVEGLAVNPAQGANTGLFYPDWEKTLWHLPAGWKSADAHGNDS